MKSGSASPEIVAALLWDVPKLMAGSPSAQKFVASLRGEPERWWEPSHYGPDPLGLAAEAVAHERANELDEAAALYRRLVERKSRWDRLLGLMLRAWSASEEGTEAIDDARGTIAAINPAAELTARLLAKLVVFALDEGAGQLGRELLAEAIELAPEGTLLRRALGVEGLNMGLAYAEPDESLEGSDALVEYSWIERGARQAAQATLAAAVEARSRRLWTFNWGVGKTPLDDAVAAEVQATWAGALWIRRPIRKQVGAQLLTGAARTPAQWGYGVVMWSLGSGKHPERAYALAEPELNGETTDFIVRTLGEASTTSRSGHRFVSVAVEAWDSVSDDVLRWVVDRVEPSVGDHPEAVEIRRLWGGYAARLEDEWIVDFRRQETAVRVSLLDMLGVDTVKRLARDARTTVFDTAVTALLSQAAVTNRLVRVLAAAAPVDVADEVRQAIADKTSSSGVARLVYENAHRLLTEDAIQGARTRLLTHLVDDNEKARSGSVSFGSEDTRLNLARLLAGRRADDREAVQLLLETALDPNLPGEHILLARNGLALVRRAGMLSAEQLEALHQADDGPGTFPEHGGITPELLRVRRLQVLALDLTSEEVVSVVGASRAQDARVRQVALGICSEAADVGTSTPEHEALAWALIGGLFDPIDDVVESAITGINRRFIDRNSAAGRVALERLPRLQDEASIPVRAAIGLLAGRWRRDEKLNDHPVVRAISAQAANDRSWIVRHAWGSSV